MMEAVEAAARTVLDAVLPWLILVAKVVGAGAAWALASQQAVEWFVAAKASPDHKRMVALALGITFSMTAHYAGYPSFGNGPQGWAAAVLSGFAGGGAAAAFHDWAKSKWFVPTRTNGGGA